MAISDKLNYLIETKQLFKDRLNSLGAEITSSTTFRNYLNWLDTFYGEVSDKTDLSVNGVIGRTSQESTTGKNKLNPNLKPNGDRGIIGTYNNSTGEITITGTPTAVFSNMGDRVDFATPLPAGTYTLSTEKVENVRIGLHLYKSGGDINNYAIALGNKELQITVTDEITGYYLYIYGLDSTKQYNQSFKAMFESGSSATDWEKYTGGNPAPNPDYPQPINNLSGNVAYKVNGKNLWNITDYRNTDITNNGRTTHSTTEDKIIINTGDTKYEGVYYKRVYQNIDNYNAQNEYYVSFDAVANQDLTLLYGESGGVQSETIISTQKVRLSQKYNPGKNLIFYSTSMRVNDTIEISNIMISTSNDTTYEPYIEPQTFNIPLGDIELCKINTYDDKIYSSNGRFYLSKNTDKYTYKGTENWNISTNFYVAVPTNYAYTNNIPFSNYFKGIINQAAANTMPTDVDNVIAVKNRYGDPRVYIRATRFKNTNELKQWLSTHNTTLYYGTLDTTTTEITQENYPSLYNALKQIQDYLTAYKINKEFILGYSSPEIEY